MNAATSAILGGGLGVIVGNSLMTSLLEEDTEADEIEADLCWRWEQDED